MEKVLGRGIDGCPGSEFAWRAVSMGEEEVLVVEMRCGIGGDIDGCPGSVMLVVGTAMRPWRMGL
eukprot:4337292-Prorocentrum_lima.AAC.1